LGICSQAFCQVFACVVIHIAKRRTSWFWDLELFTAWVQFRWKLVSRYLWVQSVCNMLMY
jgi:hypothetical protein